MGGKFKEDLNLLPEQLSQLASSRIAVITAQWNPSVTAKLMDGAHRILEKYGIAYDDYSVPGSFELIRAASRLSRKNSYDAIICLGCVIKGETDHDVYINQAIAHSLARLNTQDSPIVVYGVLTVNNIAQANDRAGGSIGNKGCEAAVSAIQMILFENSIRDCNG